MAGQASMGLGRGRLVIATALAIASGTCEIARADPVSLDPSFASGTVLFPFPPFSPEGGNVEDIAVQADGKILAAGSAGSRGPGAVVRLLPDGRPDPAFGTKGFVRIGEVSADYPYYPRFSDVALGPNGDVVLVGTTAEHELAVSRLDSSGQLDPTFGGDGTVYPELSAPTWRGINAVVDEEGRIVVAAQILEPQADGFSHYRAAAIRLDRTGEIDETFADGGQLTAEMGNTDSYGEVAAASNGSLRMLGVAHSGDEESRLVVQAFTADGLPKGDYGDGGLAFAPPGLCCAGGLEFALDGQDRAVFAMTLPPGPSSDETTFGATRLTSEGEIDSSFTSGEEPGIALIQVAPESNYARVRALTVQPDGSPVVGGITGALPGVGWVMTRFTPTGAPDETFDSDAIAGTNFEAYPDMGALATQGDGQILAGGSVDRHFTVGRYAIGETPTPAPPNFWVKPHTHLVHAHSRDQKWGGWATCLDSQRCRGTATLRAISENGRLKLSSTEFSLKARDSGPLGFPVTRDDKKQFAPGERFDAIVTVRGTDSTGLSRKTRSRVPFEKG